MKFDLFRKTIPARESVERRSPSRANSPAEAPIAWLTSTPIPETRYAWLPKRLNDGRWIWLEYYRISSSR